MNIPFIGDVHGKYQPYKRLIKGRTGTIQVGDMGVGFFKWPHMDPAPNPPHELMVAQGASFIRGNHDNPSVCRRHSQWIPDGHIENGMMFVGGAISIDAAYRIEGASWWKDEELSIAELYAMTDLYIAQRPNAMVTHDCPEEVAQLLFQRALIPGVKVTDFPSRTRQAFQSMWSAHSPKLWVFGHHHISFDHVLRGTRFVCLAELELKELEV